MTEYLVTHGIEEAAGLALVLCRSLFQLLDALGGAAQRLVLQEHGLHQRIDRVRCTREAIGNRALGVGIARRAFEPRQFVEQLVDQLAFLRSHFRSPG